MAHASAHHDPRRRARARRRSTATGTATRSERRCIGPNGGERYKPLTCTNSTFRNADEPLEGDWGSRGAGSNPVSPTGKNEVSAVPE